MDWVAGILELTALYIVGCKNRFGFILNVCCGICWIIYVVMSKGSYGLLIVVVPALFINCINFLKWSKDENQNT